VDHHYVFGVFFEPPIHLVYQVEQQVEGRRHVVLPVVIAHPVIKSALVIGPFAHVKHPVLVRVALIQEFLDLEEKLFK